METEVGQQHGDHGIDELVGHKQMFAIAGTQSHTPFVEKQLLRLVDHPSVAGLVALSLHLLIAPHEHLMLYNSKGIPSYNNSSSIDKQTRNHLTISKLPVIDIKCKTGDD